MTNYVLAFRGQAERAAVAGEEEAWGAWFGRIGTSIVDRGNRIGTEHATLPAAGGSDPATAVLTGYVVVAAADLDAATELARGCPGLANGVSVEVAEVMSM